MNRDEEKLNRWLADPEFSEWLVKETSNSIGCKVCRKLLTYKGGLSDLRKHGKGVSHQKKLIEYRRDRANRYARFRSRSGSRTHSACRSRSRSVQSHAATSKYVMHRHIYNILNEKSMSILHNNFFTITLCINNCGSSKYQKNYDKFKISHYFSSDNHYKR